MKGRVASCYGTLRKSLGSSRASKTDILKNSKIGGKVASCCGNLREIAGGIGRMRITKDLQDERENGILLWEFKKKFGKAVERAKSTY